MPINPRIDGGSGGAPRATPNPSPSSKPSPTQAVPPKPHVAPNRQSVGEVARDHGVKKSAILDANPRLRHIPFLAQGDRVDIPQDRDSRSRQYTVRQGDTPKSIAEDHGVSEQTLRDENGLESFDRIAPGEVLNLPDDANETRLWAQANTDPNIVRAQWRNDNPPADPVTAAQQRTDEAAARVQSAQLPSPQVLDALSPRVRDAMVAGHNQAQQELDAAVEAEISARANAPGQPPLTYDTLRNTAAQAVEARVRGTPAEAAVGAAVERVQAVSSERAAELDRQLAELGRRTPTEVQLDIAAAEVKALESELHALESSTVPRAYVQGTIDRLHGELATAQQNLQDAIHAELAQKVGNNTVPAQYLGGDVTAYYAGTIGDRIGITPATLEALQSATISQRVISASTDGGPERAMEVLRELTPGVSDDVMRMVMADPEMQRVTDEIADFSAAQVESAYNAEAVYGTGDFASTEKLAELTDGLPPDVAAQIINASMPTIDKALDDAISNGIHGHYPVFELLANSVGNAEGTPAGEAATAAVAGLIKDKLDAVGRDGANYATTLAFELGQRVGRGVNANLSVELARLYAADGNREIGNMQASEIGDLFLSHAADGLEALKYEYRVAAEEYAKQSEELGWILGNGPGKDATAEEREAIIADYRSRHPELAAAEARLNELGELALRNANALTALPPELRNSPSAERAQELSASFLSDENVSFAVSVSEDAQKYVSELLDRSDNGEPTLLDNISDIAKWIDKPKGFLETMGSLVTKSIVGRTLEALGPDGQNFAVASQQLDRLEDYADVLGLDRTTLSGVVDQYKIALDPNSSLDARQAALSKINTDLNEIKGGAFDATTGVGRTLRGVGLLLSIAGGGKSLQDAIKDPSAQNITGLLLDSAGLARDSAEFVSGFLKSADWTDSWWFKGSGKVLGVAGAFLGGISVLQSLADGNYAEAGFGAVGVGGGLLVAFGTSTAWTGVGAVLVIGAFVGNEIYKALADDEHENANTVAALRVMGFDQQAADVLKNQDSDLNSPVPVLMALARHTGIDMDDPAARRGFVNYINSLDKEQLEELVRVAHGVDPQEDGTYPETAGNDSNIINGPPPRVNPRQVIDVSPHSLTALESWMQQNGFKVPPTS
jgi:LysM repeat protein